MTDGLKDIRNINNKKTDVKLLREFYEQYKHTSQTYIDFVNNKTQLTVVNNDKMCNLFQTVLYKKKLREQKEKAATK